MKNFANHQCFYEAELLVPPAHLLFLVFDHVLSHLEGAQVLVHALQLRVIRGVLIPVQETVDGLVVVVNDAAVLLLVVTFKKKQQKKNKST